MTREEAILKLEVLKDFSHKNELKNIHEAIDMAIEALENNDKLAEDLQNCIEMYKKKKAEVEALKQTAWIPCSERLPENENSVLVTTSIGEVTDAKYWHKEQIWVTGFLKIMEVTAWMPLPGPWK